MAFLRKDPARRKIVLDKKCLKKVKDFEYLGCEISYEDEEMYSTKVIKIWSLGILNSTFKTTLVQMFSRIQVYMHWLSTFLYMEAKFGPVEKKYKKNYLLQ